MSSSVESTTRLDFSENVALSMMVHHQLDVASEPAVIFEGNAARHEEALNVPAQEIAGYFGQALNVGDRLSQMAIRFADTDSPHMQSYTAADAGHLEVTPLQHPETGELHFPTIFVAVSDKFSARDLNKTLRHEAGHIMQPNRARLLYEDETVVQRVQTAVLLGTYGLLGAAGDTAFHGRTAAACWLAGTAATSLLLTAPETVKGLLHLPNLDEAKADHFAWKHRKFQPITAA